ncbi:uncharacterized protein BXZ73DRAFT_101528 [Epithele typhae]|uniref:uncharacterized protein n=1 Tax=Epithele typhae TaxID=378194 RepID=UPI0020077D3F|nr:uncharacterized protein BXZ73DRAFT_101528 [Epithele typhae]KAH9931617.1 hypothetical protein BXZ73DRAFT_101528 [Epithele typhae]
MSDTTDLPFDTTQTDTTPNDTPQTDSGTDTTSTPVSLASTLPASTQSTLPDRTSSTNVGFGGNNSSESYRKAIIIASGVSGAVGLILIVVVFLLVYRRKTRGRTPAPRVTPFSQAAPKPTTPLPPPTASHARKDSDATWVGAKISTASFDESKLEAGTRTSDAHSLDSQATLADGWQHARSRSKPGAFPTPTHTPKPSMERLRVAELALVPEDPFEAARVNVAARARPSFEQSEPAVAAAPILRPRKGSAQLTRIDSTSTFKSNIIIEQDGESPVPVAAPAPTPPTPAYANTARESPGSPNLEIPLVTPMLPPAEWQTAMAMSAPPLPGFAKRDSMASLSRQSSRASSINVRQEEELVSPRTAKRTGAFSAGARKRRSKADSIDPFRKSSASVLRRRGRESAAAVGGLLRRKSSRPARSESRAPLPPPTPTTPGGQRKSPRVDAVRAARVRAEGRRSGAPRSTPPTPTTPAGPRPRPNSTASTVPRTPRTAIPMGLPRTPRDVAPRRASRASSAYSEPTTPGPRTAPLPVPPMPVPVPVLPLAPPPPPPKTPRGSRPLPTPTPRSAGAVEPRTPRTPGGRARQTRAPLPRTPTSGDMYWAEGLEAEMPPPPPSSSSLSARPLPSAPVSARQFSPSDPMEDEVLSVVPPVPRPPPSAPLSTRSRSRSRADRSARELSRTASGRL